MHTIRDIITKTTEYLQGKGVPSPRREAEELLSLVLEMPRLDLYLDLDRPLVQKEIDQCRALLKRRAAREPYSYITGRTEFFNCELYVTRDTLIPRQETEILVDKIIKTEQLEGKKALDLCTGTGCIGIALKKTVPQLQMTLGDFSDKALEVAEKNAKHNQVEVVIKQGDLFKAVVGEKFDLIVSNPPYVSEQEYTALEPEVRDYEPKAALTAGEEGLDFYKRIAEEGRDYLVPQGVLWLEIGSQQGKAVSRLFEEWESCTVMQDWAGHDRFVRISG